MSASLPERSNVEEHFLAQEIRTEEACNGGKELFLCFFLIPIAFLCFSAAHAPAPTPAVARCERMGAFESEKKRTPPEPPLIFSLHFGVPNISCSTLVIEGRCFESESEMIRTDRACFNCCKKSPSSPLFSLSSNELVRIKTI